jgi:divalent metal cation (Fe/Co/Zn/Cd) transporter
MSKLVICIDELIHGNASLYEILQTTLFGNGQVSSTATSAIKHAARSSSTVAVKALSHHGHSHAIAPNRIAVLAAIVSIISKEGLYRVTAAIGKKHNSQVSY